jgi:F0F1-type ATP synthase delta subunit
MSEQAANRSSLKKIARKLKKITAIMENQSNLHPALKAPTVTPLKGPGL